MQQPHGRQKIPKDGWGPRGAPDCYYTSRVLNSTFRYVKFIRKLRAEEEETRKGDLNKLKALKDQQCSDFFIRCDRRSLINNVAARVDLCLASYEDDLQAKRQRLKSLLHEEEGANLRKFMEQTQAGAEAVWQEKMQRLQYLLEKRAQEHKEKYKDTPLSKCSHILPCIFKIRAKEAEEIQLYQMKEKQAKKMAEIEFDKMWHAVAMKESDVLAARMEQDAIERLRKDKECKDYTDYQVEQRKIQREKEKAMLKQETLYFKALYEEDTRKEEKAARSLAEQRKATAEERRRMIEERQVVIAKQKAEEKQINDTWDSVAGQDLVAIKEKEELRKRKERDVDECNRKMIELKHDLGKLELADDREVQNESRRIQERTDKKRCDYLTKSQKITKEVRQAMVEQIKDREKTREVLKQKIAERDEYHRQLFAQMQELYKNKELVEAQNRRQHQKDLLDQIEYNKLLKERALQGEQDQLRKCKIATEEYNKDIEKMLCRPYYSDEVHPFLKQMGKGLQMKETCPCSKQTHCKQ